MHAKNKKEKPRGTTIRFHEDVRPLLDAYVEKSHLNMNQITNEALREFFRNRNFTLPKKEND